MDTGTGDTRRDPQTPGTATPDRGVRRWGKGGWDRGYPVTGIQDEDGVLGVESRVGTGVLAVVCCVQTTVLK